MTKILHVVPTYLPATRYGGPIVSVHGLACAQAQAGQGVHVCTTNVDGPGDSDVPLGVPVDRDGVQVFYFGSVRGRRLYYSSGMAKFLREHIGDYDLVHLHSVFLWPTNYAARQCIKKRVPYLLSPRGMLVPDLIRRKSRLLKSAWLRLFERKTIESAKALVFSSAREQGRLQTDETAQTSAYHQPQRGVRGVG